MKFKTIFKLAVVTAASLLMMSCIAPNTFVKTMEPTWGSIELRTDVTYEQAWETVVDTLVKRFDMEVLSRQDGYIRTNWIYTWTGTIDENYRVRVTAKFPSDRKRLDIKSEAEFGGPGRWAMGYDTRLLETIKSDIMGKIGRTTR